MGEVCHTEAIPIRSLLPLPLGWEFAGGTEEGVEGDPLKFDPLGPTPLAAVTVFCLFDAEDCSHLFSCLVR